MYALHAKGVFQHRMQFRTHHLLPATFHSAGFHHYAVLHVQLILFGKVKQGKTNTYKNIFMVRALTGGHEVPMKSIGEALVGAGKYQYVLPFEFISLFLLACIIGGLVVARKEKEEK